MKSTNIIKENNNRVNNIYNKKKRILGLLQDGERAQYFAKEHNL
jgi:hypothetical protein